MELTQDGESLSNLQKENAVKQVLIKRQKKAKTEFSETLLDLYALGIPEHIIHRLTRVNGDLYRLVTEVINGLENQN